MFNKELSFEEIEEIVKVKSEIEKLFTNLLFKKNKEKNKENNINYITVIKVEDNGNLQSH